jgi:precorrin-6Y C5,15-methyltransferase (decarboxylating)
MVTDKLVACGVEVRGHRGQQRGFGLPDGAFVSDGQMTKRPIRAITLSTLAPCPNEVLWDLGSGSGSISVEWCLAGGRAEAVELRADRANNISDNIARFGLGGVMNLHVAASGDALAALPAPNAVFIGGGASAALIEDVAGIIPSGTRLVVNGVTLETELLLMVEHAARGGNLLRIDIAEPEPLGRLRGWKASRPVLQWSWEK